MRPWRWFGPISGPCGSRGSTATMKRGPSAVRPTKLTRSCQERKVCPTLPQKRIKMNSAGNRRNDALPSRTLHFSLSSHSCPARPCQSGVCTPPEQTRELGWVGRSTSRCHLSTGENGSWGPRTKENPVCGLWSGSSFLSSYSKESKPCP